MSRIVLITGAILLACQTLLWAQGRSGLEGVRLNVGSIADSGAYLVYVYGVFNSHESSGGAALISLDVSGSPGTGFPTLPATGHFYHGAGFPGVKLAEFRDHVPIGPISPEGWKAFLTKPATVDWYSGRGGVLGEYDSIAPGDMMQGFGLRSSYLPGIRGFGTEPTFRSCCGTPRRPTPTSEAEYDDPSEFRVAGWTVGPTVRPADMRLALLRSDLDQVCGQLHWISDGTTCGALHSTLGPGTADALRAFIAELDTNHGPGKPVSDNAFWLLKVNAEYVLAHM